MPFEPFDFARIVQNAEALKTMRSNAATEELQRQYLGQRMANDQAQEARAQTEFGQKQTEFDQEQQIRITRLINMAATEVADNPGAAGRWDPILKSAIPNWEPVQGDPAQIQAAAKQIRDSTGKALQAYQINQHQQTTGIPGSLQELQAINADRATRGEPAMKPEEYLAQRRGSSADSQLYAQYILGLPEGEKPLPMDQFLVQFKGNVAGSEAGAKKTAETKSQAAFDLPRLEQNAGQALKVIEDLKKHPGLERITGLYGKVPIIPGSEGAAAAALADQIQGKTFLEAYNTLRGGGQITEVEGEKAQDAIARLNRSQSTADYVKALDELGQVISTGLERARKQAGGGQTSAPNPGRFTVEVVGE